MKPSSILLMGTLLLAGCGATPPKDAMSMELTHGTRPLQFHQELATKDNELAFSIHEGDAVFTEYGTYHTKKMHLVMVRSDLRHFSHLHPELDEKGVWHVQLQPEAGGEYWVYTDFVDGGNGHYVLLQTLKVDGDVGDVGLVKSMELTKTVRGYRVTMTPHTLSGGMLSMSYTITDGSGAQVSLEDYLGAKGHSVLISEKGRYIHTHPLEGSGNTPVFEASALPDPFYRIFTEFQIHGQVIVASFDWVNPVPAAKVPTMDTKVMMQ